MGHLLGHLRLFLNSSFTPCCKRAQNMAIKNAIDFMTSPFFSNFEIRRLRKQIEKWSSPFKNDHNTVYKDVNRLEKIKKHLKYKYFFLFCKWIIINFFAAQIEINIFMGNK